MVRLVPSLHSAGGGGLRRLFSPRTFLLALVLAVAGVVLGGFVPLVGSLGRLAGLFAAAFALGLRGGGRRYVEVGIAGGLAATLGFVLGSFGPGLLVVPALAEYGVALAGVGAGTGLLVSLAGHYFGRDLRAGLAREL